MCVKVLLMSNRNPKNRLQEYCQKNGTMLPEYNIIDLSTIECVILLNDKRVVGRGHGPTRKTAEMMAAEDVLRVVDKYESSKVRVVSKNISNSSYFIAVYIDMENINVNDLTELFKYNKYDPTQYIFYGFVSASHHYAQTDFSNNYEGIAFNKILVPSTRSDAADIGMIMTIMKRWNDKNQCNPNELVIVSRDKFSRVFVDLIQNRFCFEDIEANALNVVYCSCVEDLKKALQ